jgi:hypothetical protein
MILFYHYQVHFSDFTHFRFYPFQILPISDFTQTKATFNFPQLNDRRDVEGVTYVSLHGNRLPESLNHNRFNLKKRRVRTGHAFLIGGGQSFRLFTS